MDKVCSVILAAGDGKRMKSAKPKVLCEVLFKPMINWVTDLCEAAQALPACVVVGNGGELIQSVLPQGFSTVEQAERRGTGHAVMMAAEFIRTSGAKDVVVLCGDAPFIREQDLRGAYEKHKQDENSVTVLSAKVAEPAGYGRIVRQMNGVSAIVEEADADAETKKISEINSGAYWFDAQFLLQAFDKLTCDNAQGEYYLTDTVRLAVEQNKKVDAYIAQPDAVLGANSRQGLAQLNKIAQQRVLTRLMDDGVSIPFPDSVIVGADVTVGADTTLLPGTILRGRTVVGTDCEIGPNSCITDSRLGDGCRIISSYIEASTLEDGVKIGPMSNVRPNCHIKSRVKVGDFVELKNSVIGEGTAVAHLTYVGDSDVGSDCNFGCGVVTVNYDGEKKYRTTIGDDVFIGCNTNLMAPVSVGDRVYCAAASNITQDVPADALVIGRAPTQIKENWVKTKGKFKKKK